MTARAIERAVTERLSAADKSAQLEPLIARSRARRGGCMSDKQELPEPVAYALHHKRGLCFEWQGFAQPTRALAEDMQRRHVGKPFIVALYTEGQIAAALAAQAEKHAAELASARGQIANLSKAYNELWAETQANDYRLHAELTDACEQLSAHDAIRAQLEAERDALRETNERFGKRQEWWNDQMFALEQERDALRDTLSAIETCAERSIGCTASEMDGYMVQISHAARTGGKP